MLRCVVVRHFVNDLGIRLQCAEPMCESDRHQKLAPVCCADHSRNVFPVRRRLSANIDPNIENRSADHSYKFVLREWWNLEMQPPHDSALNRQRMIVLYEFQMNALRTKPGFAVRFRKEPSMIALNSRYDHFQVSDFSCHYLYCLHGRGIHELSSIACPSI